MPKQLLYDQKTLQKKNGGTRVIQAPNSKLKNLQRRLATLLTNCNEELIDKLNQNPLNHGFTKNRSIITNAQIHTSKRYVFNFDLEDFFPSINFGRVRGYFIKNKYFGLNPKVATIIAQIAVHQNSLPQGSPCSPIISNLISGQLDSRLFQIAKKNRCTYSRYVDDITFSTNQRDFPEAVAEYQSNSREWKVGKSVIDTVLHCGFKVNSSKTRMHLYRSRQLVTGLVTNRKTNVRREYYRLARAMFFSLYMDGRYSYPDLSSPVDIPRTKPQEVFSTELEPLQGMLSHIMNVNVAVHEKRDCLDKVYNSRYGKLYKQFVFFKYFGFSKKPFFICEGKTDVGHLKLVLKQIGANYKFSRNGIGFLRDRERFNTIFELSNGTGGLINFINSYNSIVDTFKKWKPSSPTIILVDNDASGQKVFNAGIRYRLYRKNVKKEKIQELIQKKSNSMNVLHIGFRLYIVKLPFVGGSKSVIEDLYGTAILSRKLDGRSYAEKVTDISKQYSKVEFLEKIVKPDISRLDLSNFEALFKKIDSRVNL